MTCYRTTWFTWKYLLFFVFSKPSWSFYASINFIFPSNQLSVVFFIAFLTGQSKWHRACFHFHVPWSWFHFYTLCGGRVWGFGALAVFTLTSFHETPAQPPVGELILTLKQVVTIKRGYFSGRLDTFPCSTAVPAHGSLRECDPCGCICPF